MAVDCYLNCDGNICNIIFGDLLFSHIIGRPSSLLAIFIANLTRRSGWFLFPRILHASARKTGGWIKARPRAICTGPTYPNYTVFGSQID